MVIGDGLTCGSVPQLFVACAGPIAGKPRSYRFALVRTLVVGARLAREGVISCADESAAVQCC